MANGTQVAPKARHQIVGNAGLFYSAYRLSRLGWNVMPTSRNARGIEARAKCATRKLWLRAEPASVRIAGIFCVSARKMVPPPCHPPHDGLAPKDASGRSSASL